MKTAQITISIVRIPFKTTIGHNLKTRDCSESLVIALETEEGKTGYGEGAPRDYVTGESAAALQTQAKAMLGDIISREIKQPQEVEKIILRLHSQHNAYALATALEIALLDALGQEQERSTADFLGAGHKQPVLYSAVLPFSTLEKAQKWIDLIASFGFKHLKIKVGYKGDEDVVALARERLGEAVDIRLDANRAWTYSEASQKAKTFEKYNISCIEEPLAVDALRQLPDLSRAIETPIMLDESVFTIEQARFFSDAIAADKLFFNLKLSKCGGLFAASKLLRFAENAGIPCQLGCNVGETAILSAAGRLFAQTHPLRYLEGSFAPFFMEDDLGEQPFGFAANGQAPPLVAPGLGIFVVQEKLKKYSDLQETIN